MELKDILKKLHENKEEIYSVLCSVIEVDQDQRTIHAKPLNGSAEIFDVRLQSMISGAIGLVTFPKIGSDVIVSFISKEVAYVALNSEIEKIKLDIGETSFFINSTSANLETENVNVKANDVTIDSQGVNIDCEVMTVSATETSFNSDSFKVTGTLAEIIATAVNLTGNVTISGNASVSGAVSVVGSVSLNGGANGGVPKSASLVSEINKIKQDFQDLKAKFTSWTPVNNDGGANLKTRLNSWNPNVTAVDVTDISNPQNTH
jgi:hypothetical protein